MLVAGFDALATDVEMIDVPGPRPLAGDEVLIQVRGAPRAAVGDLEDVLLRVSAMSDAHPEISELDLNPVIVGTDGAVIVDARVRVEAPPPKRPSPSLGQ
jgi:hypothetical protein